MFAFNVWYLLGRAVQREFALLRGAEAVTRTNLNYTYQLSATALFRPRT